MRHVFTAAVFLAVIGNIDAHAAERAPGTGTSKPTETGDIQGRMQCAENRIAFGGKCRGANFFSTLAAPNYQVVSATGCRALGTACSESVSITEIGPNNAVRNLVLGLPVPTASSPRSETAGTPVKTDRSSVEQIARTAGQTTTQPEIHERGGFPMISRVIQESAKDDVGITLTMRGYLFESGGTSPRLVQKSTFAMTAPNPDESGSWGADLTGSFCSEDGKWPLAVGVGMSEECDAQGCLYTHTFCPPPPAVDSASSSTPSRRGTTTQSQSRRVVHGGSSCSNLEYPEMFMRFSSAQSDENGLVCREGSGKIGVAFALPSGSAEITATVQTCSTMFEIAETVGGGLCTAAMEWAASASGALNVQHELTFAIGDSIGFEISMSDLSQSFSAGRDWFKQYAGKHAASCGTMGAILGSAVGNLMGCAEGACNGSQAGVPVTATFEASDGSQWSCEGTADLDCSGGSTGSQIGDSDCSCQFDQESFNVSLCRPAG